MSLLMKALEKAAKDRGEARPNQPQAVPLPAAGEPQLAPAPARPEPPPGTTPIPTPVSELTLEPLGAPAPRPASAPAPSAEPPLRGRTQEPLRTGAKPSPEQEHAATVLQATSRPEAGVGTYLRSRPLVVFSALAGLFAVGFGIYFYLQIFHPGFFVHQAPVPKVPPPLARAPAPAAAPAPAGDLPLPLPTAPLLRQPPGGTAAAGAVAAAPPATARPPLTAGAPPPPSQPEPAARRNTIVVSPGSLAPRIDPLLNDAYAALTANRIETAGPLYERLLKSDPRNIDALLGLAAIAVRSGKVDDAVQRYVAILELDPRNAPAQSGLIALLGRADPLAAESRLKQLIARDPSAHLYFTLGNLYADQSLWAQAQHAYFQAHHLEPANPDYAYNLAVGLDHVNQRKLALGFYQRAVALAATRPHVNFDVARARERVSRLAPPAQ